MADHEPECYFWEPSNISCICDRLRLARDRGYGEAMDDGWGEPEHIKAAVIVERERIREGVMDFYRVAPLAAEPMLRVIDDRQKDG